MRIERIPNNRDDGHQRRCVACDSRWWCAKPTHSNFEPNSFWGKVYGECTGSQNGAPSRVVVASTILARVTPTASGERMNATDGQTHSIQRVIPKFEFVRADERSPKTATRTGTALLRPAGQKQDFDLRVERVDTTCSFFRHSVFIRKSEYRYRYKARRRHLLEASKDS